MWQKTKNTAIELHHIHIHTAGDPQYANNDPPRERESRTVSVQLGILAIFMEGHCLVISIAVNI